MSKSFEELFSQLTETARTRPEGSGTVARLDAGVHSIGKKIGALSADAAATIGKPNAKHLLQGRNENTGLFMPSETMLKFGKDTPALIAK